MDNLKIMNNFNVIKYSTGKVRTPEIYCKTMELNPNHSYVKEYIENWVSGYLKTEWKDSEELIGFCLYSFPNCMNRDKLILIVKALTWGFLVDDHLDKYPDQIDHWLQIIEQKKASNNDYLELIFEEMMGEIMNQTLSYSQKIRLIHSFLMLVESYKVSSRIRDLSLKASIEVLTGTRFADSGALFCYVFIEFYLGIDLSLMWNVSEFRTLHEKIAEHSLIVNDIYSYKKEMIDGKFPEYCYMSVARKDTDITFEESIERAVERLHLLDIEISDQIKKVQSITNEIPIEYFEEILNMKDGNHYWSKFCKRYNP